MSTKKTRSGYRVLPIANVYPNPDQPRKLFDSAALEDLAASIKQHGLIQPIKVRPDAKGEFMIVCGERRYRAHMLLGVATIPCLVVEATDDELADAAIIENLQRKDITPLEEARAFQARLDSGLTVEDLAHRLGLKQPHRITERTALLKLAAEFQDALAKGILSPSQAYEMSRLEHGYQRLLFQAIRAGRCKTYKELRVVTAALLDAQRRNDGAAPLSLAGAAQSQQAELLAFPEPTPEQRACVTAMEAKISRVVDILQGGFKDNEVVIAAKVSPRNADAMADKLELIEKQMAKLRLALRAAAATSQTAAA